MIEAKMPYNPDPPNTTAEAATMLSQEVIDEMLASLSGRHPAPRPSEPAPVVYRTRPGERVIVVQEDMLEEIFGARNADGDILSYRWNDIDPTTGISSLVVERTSPSIDYEDETLFLTSNSRIHAAFKRIYRNDPYYADDLTRHLLRRLDIPEAPID